MKEKTFLKLQKRFLALPLHHIDTDIIIESGKGTKLGDICSAYLNKVGYTYRGVVPLSVLGEFLLIIIRDIETVEQKELTLRAFNSLVKKRKIGFKFPIQSTYQNAVKIINLDQRIEPTDALHYAIAVQDDANAFVTFDEKMVDNKALEKEFGVEIKHPKNL